MCVYTITANLLKNTVDKQQIWIYNIIVTRDVAKAEKRDTMSNATKNIVNVIKETFDDCAHFIDEIVMNGQL